MKTRKRITSRKVSSSPAWIKEYLTAHTKTAEEMMQDCMDRVKHMNPDENLRARYITKFIMKNFGNNIKVCNTLKEKYVPKKVFNPITVL
tara:strand:+ start:11863 stop:12132 length:270 start_codon:yes stop_codon:yes gene_type:complete